MVIQVIVTIGSEVRVNRIDGRHILPQHRIRHPTVRRKDEIEGGMVAAHVDLIVAGPTADRHVEFGAGAQDVNLVVAGPGPQFQALNVREGGVPTGSDNEVLRHDEEVADGGPVDDDRVRSLTAVDMDVVVLEVIVVVQRRSIVLGVHLNGVRAGASAYTDVFLFLMRRVLLNEEAVEHKGVIAVLAVEPQLAQVVVDLEFVVAVATVDVGHRRNAIGGPAEIDHGNVVLVQYGCDRPDRHVVRTGAGVDLCYREIVVKKEGVGSPEAAYDEPLDLTVDNRIGSAAGNPETANVVSGLADRVEDVAVFAGGAEDDQGITTFLSPGVGNRDLPAAVARQVEDILLR